MMKRTTGSGLRTPGTTATATATTGFGLNGGVIYWRQPPRREPGARSRGSVEACSLLPPYNYVVLRVFVSLWCSVVVVLSNTMDRRIIHIDMDEFFAAVEKLDHPDLRGKPLLIGGQADARGVVATASYEARPFGCHSAMPMAKAVRLCPNAIVLPVRHERYSQVSRQIFDVLDRFSPLIEPLSIDEAFLDVTGCERLMGPAPEIAMQIKRAVREEVGLTASLGVAPNKFLAKLASDLKKPDGLVVIEEQDIHDVLDGLPVSKLWGVGPAAGKVFHRLGIQTIGQVRRMPLEVLVRAFGQSSAEHYHRLANGLDDRPVVSEGQAKSIGHEETFAHDVGDLQELRNVLLQQVEQVGQRLRKHQLRAKTVSLKIRYGDFTTISRSKSLPCATDATQELWQAASDLLEQWARQDFRPLRLLGVTSSNLTGACGGQLSLFDYAKAQKDRQLDRALDDIASRFGNGKVRLGRP